MNDIDRRCLLGSLAATTLCGSVASTIEPATAADRPSAAHEGGQFPGGWLLARQYRPHHSDHVVDFWARPWRDIPYTQYLPQEIARGAIWYETLGRENSLESMDSAFNHYCFDWSEIPRRYAAHFGPAELFAATLRPLIEDVLSSSAVRTAFLSLDSVGPSREPGWAEVLPAFRSCYDHVIGHFHLPQRGLRQWRQFLNSHFTSTNEGGYFREYFSNAAAQCDSVILTSAALAESDLICSRRASTEELVGRLMRHLGCALLTPAVLERIVRVGENGTVRKPRFFALSSLAVETMDDYYIYSDLMIRRQADLVRGSFGEGTGEHFLLVATAAEDLNSGLVDEIRRAAAGSFFTTSTPAHEVEKRDVGFLNMLQMITLWPFEFDEEKLRSA